MRFILVRCCLIAVWSLLSLLQSVAQSAAIYDEANLFKDEAKVALERSIVECYEVNGVRVHVLMFKDIEKDISAEASRFLKTQSSAQPTVAVSYAWGIQMPEIMGNVALSDHYAISSIALLFMQLKDDFLKSEDILSEKLVKLVTEMKLGLKQIELDAALGEKKSRPLSLILSVIAALAFISCALLLVLRKLSRNMEKLPTYYFPDVEVGTRIGALYGGGTMGVARQESETSTISES